MLVQQFAVTVHGEVPLRPVHREASFLFEHFRPAMGDERHESLMDAEGICFVVPTGLGDRRAQVELFAPDDFPFDRAIFKKREGGLVMDAEAADRERDGDGRSFFTDGIERDGRLERQFRFTRRL